VARTPPEWQAADRDRGDRGGDLGGRVKDLADRSVSTNPVAMVFTVTPSAATSDDKV